MALLDALTGAELVIIDEDARLAYAWYGGAGVNVYDESGREVHHFTIGAGFAQKLTPKMVRAAIDRVRRTDNDGGDHVE